MSNHAVFGGGLYAVGGEGLVLNQVTIAGNNAAVLGGSGGGIYTALGTDTRHPESTISGNSAEGNGGGPR